MQVSKSASLPRWSRYYHSQNDMEGMTLYDGGWYQWQMEAANPVQVGNPADDSCEHTTVGELPTDKAAK